MVTPGAKKPTPDYGERLDALVAAGDRSGAVRHFMRNAMGIPAPIVTLMRLMPMWKGLTATAHTLPYDWAALGQHTMYGAPLRREWAAVTVRTLVVYGAKSPEVLQRGSRALADVLPNAELRELEGVGHNLKMKVLAPVVAGFLTGETEVAAPGSRWGGGDPPRRATSDRLGRRRPRVPTTCHRRWLLAPCKPLRDRAYRTRRKGVVHPGRPVPFWSRSHQATEIMPSGVRHDRACTVVHPARTGARRPSNVSLPSATSPRSGCLPR